MRSTGFTLVSTAVRALLTHTKRLLVMRRTDHLEGEAALGVMRLSLVTLRLLFAAVIMCALATSSLAQSNSTDGEQKSPRQSGSHVIVPQTRETTRSVLKTARNSGAEMVGIIEFPETMLPEVIDHQVGRGKIVAVYVRSLTTDWKGVSYATTESPITKFSQAIERFGRNHRLANPKDHNSLFGVDAFAVKTTAESIDLWLALFPNAKLAYARELSPEGIAQFRARRAVGLVDVYIPRLTPSAERPETPPQLVQQPSSDPFQPTSATLSVNAPASNTRMISGSFSWSSDAALSGLKTPFSTLEIQTLFLNHSTDSSQKTTYVGNKFDHAATWSFAYYDTQFLDELGVQGDPQERDYTVGAWNSSSAFRANTPYTFWIATNPGVLSANMVKFAAQKGTYIPTPIICDVDPSYCVYPILGGTEFFSPLMPNGPGAQTYFSIVAPTVFPFTYPDPVCEIPPGQPEVSTTLKSIPPSDAIILGNQMAAVQKAFVAGGGKPGIGCATSRLHEDRIWWPRGGKTQDFDGNQTGNGPGAIMLAPDASQAFWVHGAIWTRYSSDLFGGPKSVIGEPTSDEKPATSSRGTTGAYQSFTRGYLYFNSSTNQTVFVANAIADKYRSVNLHNDPLGFPVSDEYDWAGGARSDFEGGYIHWTAATGAVIVRYPNYVGYVDQGDCNVIYGWAADRNRLNTAIDVKLYDGATLIATIPANQSRNDVGSYLGDNGLHGFSIPTPASLKNSQPHSLSIRFESSATNLTNSPRTINCSGTPTPTPTPTPIPGTNYVGYVDQGDCNVIYGWSADRNRLNTAIDVKLYDGVTLIATIPANQPRNDVGSYLGDNGLHGFNIPTPASLKNGQPHSLSIRFESSATNLTNSPRTINCSSTGPAPQIGSISPNPVPTFNANQNVQVSGSNFQSGLTVDVFNSSGVKVGTLSGSQIQNLTSTSFTMVIFLGSSASSFGIEVINPDSARSARFNFSTTTPTPSVSSINPASPPAVNNNQNVQVSGSSFQSGLTVDVFNSSGTKIGTLSGSQILSTTPNSFTMVINLGGTAGNFGIEVINPSGGRSQRFNFSTHATSPTVSSISPNPVPTFNANQNVQVSGNNFQSGLTVDVFNSSGVKVGTLSGSQIQNVTSTSFTMVIFLGSAAGSFGIEVVNPNGGRSSRFTFSTTTPTPSVSSISPNPVPVFNGNQNVQVSGSNFQSGLTVDVFNGSGVKVGTLSGSQVLNVTPSSFRMVINLGSTAGSFGIEVVNPSGRRSGRFNFSTQ